MTPDPCIANVGETDVMNGTGTTEKKVVVVKVIPLTVTEIGPVVAVGGTTTVRMFEVADETVANAPLKLTSLEIAVVLKFCPEIVTVAPALPDCGVNPNTASELGEGSTVRLIEAMFPTTS
jgi:hypothetical protein